jgi:hypothetical protein
MHPRLPNDRESALSMSCSERGRAGKACTYVSETASGHGALRGTSRHIGDHAGEGVPPRPHRDLPPSITPSKEAVAGDESSRAIVCITPAGAGAINAPALSLPRLRVFDLASGKALDSRILLLLSSVFLASNSEIGR